MVALATLAQAVLGPGTSVYGAAVVPTSPASLSVNVNPGAIYSQASIEPTAISSLQQNATQILKQGILLSASPFTFVAPGTTGQSQNYLLQAQYQDVDANLIVPSFYNAANPSQPFSGANNLGATLPKTRQGKFVLQVVPGTPATTGSQTTPATTSGWVPLAVVTVAFGQTTITSSSIAVPSGNPYALGPQSGSFTLTATGFSGSAPSGTAYYRTSGPICTLQIPLLQGTSNLATCSANSLPAAIFPFNYPGGTQYLPLAYTENNGAVVSGGIATITPNSSSIVFLLSGSGSGFTASGQKAVQGLITYQLY